MTRSALLRLRAAPFRALRGRAWLVFLGWMAGLTSVYAVARVSGPRWLDSGPVFNALGLSAVGAIVVAARSHSPRRRLPWYLFAFGQALFVLGDVLSYNDRRIFGRALPFPSVADAFYLAFYVPLIVGLLLLINERREERDRGSLVDALTVTIAAGGLSWTYLMAPYAHAALGLPTKLVSLGYPLMDVLVLGVLVHLLIASGRRAIGFSLLVLGFATLLVTDSIYGWLLLHGGYEPGGLLDIGWAGFYALLGASALHPSTQQTAGPRTTHDVRLTGRRIALLGAATLTTPALMLVREGLGRPSDVEVLAIVSLALFTLVLLRMTCLVRRHDEVVRREAVRTAELVAAEKSAKAKDRFVSQVSHELRTPLTSIRGFLALLLESDGAEMSAAARHRYLAIVDRNADRLLRLVEDLLLVAQMDDRGFALDETELDLAEVASEAVEAARPLADGRGIALRGPGGARLLLSGDRTRIGQVIDNLLSNALKFTPEGGAVSVETARVNGSVRLVVRDTGVGVEPDELGRLFERFYRTEAATAQAVQGSGLGLSISKSIVEAHGGTIAADSLPGVGTSMTVDLPAAPDLAGGA